MKFITLRRPFVTLFTGFLKLFSGEPTTERKKITALLLALRSAQQLTDEIIREHKRFNASFRLDNAQRIVRANYPIICNPGPTIGQLHHWINKASDLITSLAEVGPENESNGIECVRIVESMAEQKYLAELFLALDNLKKMKSLGKERVEQLERTLLSFQNTLPNLVAA